MTVLMNYGKITFYKMPHTHCPYQILTTHLTGYRTVGDRCLSGKEIKCRWEGLCNAGISQRQGQGQDSGDQILQNISRGDFLFNSYFLSQVVFKWIKIQSAGFPSGLVVKNPPPNVGDMGLISRLGRFHMPRSS